MEHCAGYAEGLERRSEKDQLQVSRTDISTHQLHEFNNGQPTPGDMGLLVYRQGGHGGDRKSFTSQKVQEQPTATATPEIQLIPILGQTGGRTTGQSPVQALPKEQSPLNRGVWQIRIHRSPGT